MKKLFFIGLCIFSLAQASQEIEPVTSKTTKANKQVRSIIPSLKIIAGFSLMPTEYRLINMHRDLKTQPDSTWWDHVTRATVFTIPTGLTSIGLIIDGSYELHQINRED